jgi:hypothetical protein
VEKTFAAVKGSQKIAVEVKVFGGSSLFGKISFREPQLETSSKTNSSDF